MEININDQNLTQKIAEQIGISDSTIKRYRKDINKNSLHNRNVDKAPGS